MDFIVSFIVAALIMGLIDSIWLSRVANRFYKQMIGPLLLAKPNFIAAVLFYVIYVVGIVAFAILPAIDADSWQTALSYGALFGFIAYATYDLTNRATLKGFPTKLVVVDMAWGTFLTATVATLSYHIIQLI